MSTYTNIKIELDKINEYINDCGKIPAPYVKTLQQQKLFTDECINLLKEDFSLFVKCIQSSLVSLYIR